MKRRVIHSLALLWLVCTTGLTAQHTDTDKSASSRLAKTQTLDHSKAILVNNLFSYFLNNGQGGTNPYTGDDGLEYTPASFTSGGYVHPAQLMFVEGVVWAGYHRGTLKAGGSSFKSGLQAGAIMMPGTPTSLPVASDRTSARARVYRVRRDVSAAAPQAQAIAALASSEVPLLVRYEASITARGMYDEYIRDWNEWPGNEGAPYQDVNHNGIYEPAADIPGVPGADQTLWYVCNDLDSVRTKRLYGSLPIGIEMQKTLWAYHRPGALDNTIFQRTRIINKSGSPVDSMFVTQFSDTDIGGSLGYTDDYVGTDTLRNMGYTYNATSSDGFFGARPPAVGFDLLAGPAVPGSPSDSAFVNFSYRKGMKNMPLASMTYFVKTREPALGIYKGTLEFYDFMKGLVVGQPVVNPETGARTTFVFPGNPVSQSGWVEGDRFNTSGLTYTPADRRMCITTGPFTMAPADTQEILIAEIVGVGSDRLGSVASLQSNDDAVENIFRGGFSIPSTPLGPTVHASGWNGKILLEWTDAASHAAAEAYASAGYTFQGHNVYQLPDSDISRAKRILTSDIIDDVTWVVETVYDPTVNQNIPKVAAYGSNSGLQRYLIASFDSLTGRRMVNGVTYRFAVTSCAYNPAATAGSKIIESTPTVIEVTPHQPLPGMAAPVAPGDIISRDASRVRSGGLQSEAVIVSVIDPAKVTGHTYAVVFSNNTNTSPWGVFDSTANTYVLTNQIRYAPVFTYTPGSSYSYVNSPTDPIVDGLLFTVSNRSNRNLMRWSISTSGLEPGTYSVQKAALDVQRINVYPNPYFAGNTHETRKFEHFVTFSHLPQKAVINILALSGVRVRTIVKDDPAQFLRWDLTNESGNQVAAGMYVVYISLPELGTQKVLKLAVIPAATIPDHW